MQQAKLPARSSAHIRRLDYTFRKGEYAQIVVSHPGQTDDEYIVFVHDVYCQEKGNGRWDYSLLLTMYSFVRTCPLVSACKLDLETMETLSDKELLLHFQVHTAMGERQDAGLVKLRDIKTARGVNISSAGVEHVVEIPEGIATTALAVTWKHQTLTA